MPPIKKLVRRSGGNLRSLPVLRPENESRRASAVDEYSLEFAPDGHEPFQIQLVRHLVVVAVVLEPDVVRW